MVWPHPIFTNLQIDLAPEMLKSMFSQRLNSTPFNYQNQNGFEGEFITFFMAHLSYDSGEIINSQRRSSIWSKQSQRSNSIWNMTDD